ncbi:WD40-repeat-containing domain protein [Tricharina praecox]|uniref:WD40-repeat-containing domain protein n=1 Tax=Tricharina praecox TaxID=43433 RepID=UPI002220668F|nr:WD40-repeat-containing domain protein [Tricharina praecox]KAI5854050.1 WD40-repeat-containing domain protein [Tricharina praecox]
MLSEKLLVATTRTVGDGVDTPSIAYYNLHTGAAISTIKRSQSSARGVTATSTHIFAQQNDKAVVNVYSSSTGTLQSAIPFPGPITILSASPCGMFLAAGNAGGRVYVWELATARVVAPPTVHLQKISALAWGRGGHLVVGSEDATVSVWSLPVLLNTLSDAPRPPERVLNRHIHAVTAVAVGGATSGGPSELLVTAGRDRTIITWELHTGQHLRTYMVSGIPLCVTLDPAERAMYVGFEEGGIQCVEFHSATAGSGKEMTIEEYADVPVTVVSEVWGTDDSADGRSVLSLAVNYEGNMVVSGNQRGEVGVWDVSTGCLLKNLCQMKAPVTSLQMTRPKGFLITSDSDTTSMTVVPTPRYEVILAATAPSNYDQRTYSVSVTLPSYVPETSTSSLSTSTPFGFRPKTSTFGPDSDMEQILHGAREMKALKPALAGDDKIAALESELAGLYESYERLAEVHRKTWNGMVGMVLKDEK